MEFIDILIVVLIVILMILCGLILWRLLFKKIFTAGSDNSNQLNLKVTKNNVIIHISGASGSGKTTLGNKLKENFGDKIIVKDIDDLRTEFIKEFYGEREWKIIDKEAYQKFLDKYVESVKTQNKPLILVGLNIMPWWHEGHYYDMHAEYKFYIELDDNVIIKQKCLRLFKDLPNDKMAMKDLEDENRNEKFVKLVKEAIDRECDYKESKKMNDKWKKDYTEQDYKFMTREDIYKEVTKILNEILNKTGISDNKNTSRGTYADNDWIKTTQI